jgi:hypothetical protein
VIVRQIDLGKHLQSSAFDLLNRAVSYSRAAIRVTTDKNQLGPVRRGLAALWKVEKANTSPQV